MCTAREQPVRPADLEPHMLFAEQIEEEPIFLLLLRMDISKMVDDQRQRHASDQFGLWLEEVRIQVQIDYPAERFDLRHHMLKLRLIEHAAVARQAIETHAAYATGMQLAVNG